MQCSGTEPSVQPISTALDQFSFALDSSSREPILGTLFARCWLWWTKLALMNEVGFDERMSTVMNDVGVVCCCPQRENYHSIWIRRLDFMLERRNYQFVGAKCSYNFYICRSMLIASSRVLQSLLMIEILLAVSIRWVNNRDTIYTQVFTLLVEYIRFPMIQS